MEESNAAAGDHRVAERGSFQIVKECVKQCGHHKECCYQKENRHIYASLEIQIIGQVKNGSKGTRVKNKFLLMECLAAFRAVKAESYNILSCRGWDDSHIAGAVRETDVGNGNMIVCNRVMRCRCAFRRGKGHFCRVFRGTEYNNQCGNNRHQQNKQVQDKKR